MIKKLRLEIFPLDGVQLHGEYKIADHINLLGSSPRLGFNPVGEIYVHKHDPEAIIVAGIKPGLRPNAKETQTLKDLGVKAYSYNLVEEALYAAANGDQLDVIAYVPKIPQGFNLFGISAGIKQSNSKDLSIIYSSQPCAWAAAFTKNQAKAICVTHNQELYQEEKFIRALISNSGNANACTGEEGAANDKQMRNSLAQKFKLDPNEVLTASTGKIGVQLPIEKIINAIDDLGKPIAETGSVIDFAEAMLTTDLVLKISQDSRGSMLGFAKGSGMIMPNMATMLAYIISDLRIFGLDAKEAQGFFRLALKEAIEQSFNRISVDGDTSTNDMVIFMSNLQGREISKEEFRVSLLEACQDLAYKIIADGEGLTKIIKLTVSGLDDEDKLEKIARKIINSPLVKTAIFGNDPNWGRIIASAGQAAAENDFEIDFAQSKLSILGYEVFAHAMPSIFIQDPANKSTLVDLMKKNKLIAIELILGPEARSLTMLGNDLAYGYIDINAEYN